jgi:dipeptidyl aminopeptidase/acylaminoacyl peptidase
MANWKAHVVRVPLEISFVFLMVSLLGCKGKTFQGRDDTCPFDLVFDSPDHCLHVMDIKEGTETRLENITGHRFELALIGARIFAFQRLHDLREEWLISYKKGMGSFNRFAFVKADGVFGPTEASVSPDGRRIAFLRASKIPFSTQICLAHTDGGEVRTLEWEGVNSSISWSTDSKTISFTSVTESTSVTCWVDVDRMRLGFPPQRPRGLCFGFCWSPDGRSIAFSGKADSTWLRIGKLDVYVSDIEGKSVKRLTHDGQSWGPRWSPNGEKVLFVSSRGGDEKRRFANVYVMGSDGSDVAALTTHGQVEWSVYKWSPDGRKVAYVYRDMNSKLSIHIVNSDGTNDMDVQAPFSGTFDWIGRQQLSEWTHKGDAD